MSDKAGLNLFDRSAILQADERGFKKVIQYTWPESSCSGVNACEKSLFNSKSGLFIPRWHCC